MKTKRLILALILALSIMNVPMVKADTGGGQDTNEIRKRCPRGYVKVNGQCVQAQGNFADTSQSNVTNDAESLNESDVEEAIIMGIVNGILFYVFGNVV